MKKNGKTNQNQNICQYIPETTSKKKKN